MKKNKPDGMPRHCLHYVNVCIVISIMICCLLDTACRFDTSTRTCKEFDLQCRSGQVCATKQQMGVCVDIGGCGDKKLNTERGEICDDGNLDDGDGCDSNCLLSGCPNGIVTDNEMCDDGNLVNGDGCDNNCTLTSCGNGIRSPSEECDGEDNNTSYACSIFCHLERCGNGIIDPNEACDLGVRNSNSSSCTEGCKNAVCGDGFVFLNNEQCDDGNLINSDGCDEYCTNTRCNNGIRTAGEACDDGNASCGTCDETCLLFGYSKATAEITIVTAVDATKFIVNNGLGGFRIFEFDDNGMCDSGNVCIDVANQDAFVARDRLVSAIATANMLDVRAYAGADNIKAMLTLVNERYGKIYNDLVVIAGNVQSQVGFNSRGVGADCAVGETCESNLDCRSNSCSPITRRCI